MNWCSAIRFHRMLRLRPSTGIALWPTPRGGPSMRSGSSGGPTIGTMAPAYRAICLCTCFRASTSCSTRKDRRGRWPLGLADYAEGAPPCGFQAGSARRTSRGGPRRPRDSGSWARKASCILAGTACGPARPSSGARLQYRGAAEFLREYRKKYPPRPAALDSLLVTPAEEFPGPERPLRSRRPHGQFSEGGAQPQTGGGGRGVRLARGRAALLANASHFERKICGWDPRAMERT